MKNKNIFIISFIILFIILGFSCKGVVSNDNKIEKDSIYLNELSLFSEDIDLSDEYANNILKKYNYNVQLVLDNYWNDIDFYRDSLWHQKIDSLRPIVINFLGLATSSNLDVDKSLLKPLNDSRGDLLRDILFIYYEYLYKYDSPLKNHQLYEKVLQWALKSSKLIDEEHKRASILLKSISNNRVGDKIQDISYMDKDGVRKLLSRNYTKYNLLVLFSPNCAECENTYNKLLINDKIQDMIKAKKLKVLFIYPGNDENSWKNKVMQMTDLFEVGIASDKIISEGLYDIQAWPSMYLFSSEGIVLLSDTNIEDFKKYIFEYR